MRWMVMAALALAGCSDPAPDAGKIVGPVNAVDRTPVAAATTALPLPPPLPDDGRRPAAYPGEFVAADYLGRWIGVEGMVLDIAETAKAGEFRLTMQWDLDHKGTFTGHGVGEPMAPGIAFRRDGEELLLRQTDGDATGLKYLAGKRDCLTVKPGEGYCRD